MLLKMLELFMVIRLVCTSALEDRLSTIHWFPGFIHVKKPLDTMILSV